ncbi:MAG: hypothetical protein LKF88_05965 [Microbacteriaceae bacterium]|nr:hypothetical protein [Microbacteriaceae bacterium]
MFEGQLVGISPDGWAQQGVVGLSQLDRWGLDLVAFSVDQDLLEEHQVQASFERIRRVAVGLGHVVRQLEGRRDVLLQSIQVLGAALNGTLGFGQLLSNPFLFLFEQVQGDRIGVVGFQQLLLLPVQLFSLSSGPTHSRLTAVPLRAQYLMHEALQLDALLACNLDALVELLDLALHLVDQDGLEVAGTRRALPGCADVVGIDRAALRGGHLDAQPGAAMPAVNGGFQEMIMDTLALAGPPRVQDLLYPEPGLSGR